MRIPGKTDLDDGTPRRRVSQAQRAAFARASTERNKRLRAAKKLSYSDAGWRAHHAEKKGKRKKADELATYQSAQEHKRGGA